MISASQRNVLSEFEMLLGLCPPDMRIGQLFAWLGDLGEDMDFRGLGDMEDEELLIVINRFKCDLQAGVSNSAESA